jgi:hypothetical protein
MIKPIKQFFFTLAAKLKILPCFIAALFFGSFCVSCENPWMKEILEPFFNKVYAVGETGPGGGKVFYKDEAGFLNTYTNTICRYLEAAPDDAGNGTRFAWAKYGTEAYDNVTGTSAYIGAGRMNTALILATDETAPAALACINYRGGGKTDWFLPSIDELEAIISSGVVPNVDFDEQTEKYCYWSSTQNKTSDDSAYYYHLKEGKIRSNNKDFINHARPIRAF